MSSPDARPHAKWLAYSHDDGRAVIARPQSSRMPRRRIEPEPNFRLQIKRGVVLGPGKVALLEHIAELGSISRAGKAMQMSYRTAWALVTVTGRLLASRRRATWRL